MTEEKVNKLPVVAMADVDMVLSQCRREVVSSRCNKAYSDVTISVSLMDDDTVRVNWVGCNENPSTQVVLVVTVVAANAISNNSEVKPYIFKSVIVGILLVVFFFINERLTNTTVPHGVSQHNGEYL